MMMLMCEGYIIAFSFVNINPLLHPTSQTALNTLFIKTYKHSRKFRERYPNLFLLKEESFIPGKGIPDPVKETVTLLYYLLFP